MIGEHPVAEVIENTRTLMLMQDMTPLGSYENLYTLAVQLTHMEGRTWQHILRAFSPQWRLKLGEKEDMPRTRTGSGDPWIMVLHLGTVVEVVATVKRMLPLRQTRSIPQQIVRAAAGEMDHVMDALSSRELKDAIRDMEGRYPNCCWALQRADTILMQASYESLEARDLGASLFDWCIMRLACVIRYSLARAAVRSWERARGDDGTPTTHQEIVMLMEDRGTCFPQHVHDRGERTREQRDGRKGRYKY
jgi:hypothetical protein